MQLFFCVKSLVRRLCNACRNVAQTSSGRISESVCPCRNNFGQILNFTFRLNFRTFRTRTRDLQFWRTRTRTQTRGIRTRTRTRTRDFGFWWTQTRTRTRSLRTRTRTRTRESGNSPNTAKYYVSILLQFMILL